MSITYDSSYELLTWDEARSKVRSQLWRTGDDGIPQDQVDRALLAALLELEAERDWHWLENINASLTVTPSQDFVNLDDDSVKHIENIAFKRGTTGYEPLIAEPLARVRERAEGSTSGVPCFYALSRGTIYFDTTLEDNAEFEMIFTAGCPVFLAKAIFSPSITLTMQQQAVMPLAASYVALEYMKNSEEHARQRGSYERHLRRLENEDDSYNEEQAGGGGIIPDLYFQHLAHG